MLALSAIIVTGAAVRLTGSGLGCSDWPSCEEGEFVASLSFHPMVEFVNRLITGLVSFAVALAVLGSIRRTPRRKDLTAWSWSLVAGVVAQIIIGAAVTLSELKYSVVAVHFLVSMALVAASTLLVHRSREGDGPRIPVVGPWSRRLAPVLGALLYATFLQVPFTALRAAFADRRFLLAALVLKQRRGRGRRGGLPPVEGRQLLARRIPGDQEGAAAQAGGLWLDQTQHKLRRDRRVDGAPAFPQHLGGGRGGIRIGDRRHPAFGLDQRLGREAGRDLRREPGGGLRSLLADRGLNRQREDQSKDDPAVHGVSVLASAMWARRPAAATQPTR